MSSTTHLGIVAGGGQALLSTVAFDDRNERAGRLLDGREHAEFPEARR